MSTTYDSRTGLTARVPSPAGTAVAQGAQARAAEKSRRRRDAQRRRSRPRLGRTLLAAAALTLLASAVVACGSSGNSPAASHSAIGYLTCLSQHRGAPGGARQACRSQRPPGGLKQLLQQFTGCLHAHHVTLPAAASSSGGKGAWQEILRVKSGSRAQRAAFDSCKSALSGS